MNAIKALSILRHQSDKHPSTLTSRQLTVKYNNRFDCLHDWHEASSILDQAHSGGLISVTGIDSSGMTIYKW